MPQPTSGIGNILGGTKRSGLSTASGKLTRLIGLGLKGLVTDENRYQNHLKPPFGEREPRSLAPLEVDRLRLELLLTRRPGTVKNVLELLRRLVNFAAKKRLCEIPTFTIEMPQVNNIKTEDLTAQQLARLLEALDESPQSPGGPFDENGSPYRHEAGRALSAQMGGS